MYTEREAYITESKNANYHKKADLFKPGADARPQHHFAGEQGKTNTGTQIQVKPGKKLHPLSCLIASTMANCAISTWSLPFSMQ